jgi:hypothetical protein
MSVPQVFAYHDGKVIDRFGVICEHLWNAHNAELHSLHGTLRLVNTDNLEWYVMHAKGGLNNW